MIIVVVKQIVHCKNSVTVLSVGHMTRLVVPNTARIVSALLLETVCHITKVVITTTAAMVSAIPSETVGLLKIVLVKILQEWCRQYCQIKVVT